jgi:hypothetical protein
MINGENQKKWLIACLVAMLAIPPVTAFAIDADGDGHASYADGGDDCDDSDPDRYPGNVEVCDVINHDEDCDYTTGGFRDADADGFSADDCYNVGPGGTIYGQGRDCDDFKTSVNPLTADVCNHIDDNCNGDIDENAPYQYVDWDLDGHGNPSEAQMRVCPGTAGFTELGNDCDDTNSAIGPGDILCVTDGDTAVLMCNDSGQYQPASCPEGLVCVTQTAGNGVCVPAADKGGKKK